MQNTLIILACLFTTCCASSWDSVEMEIYDLYEEINGTFYELLNVTQDATTSEVRRAYRRLSLILHPDKNKAEDAEEKFRQLVAVYEILKDSGKREKYEEVLKNGLPDWRQPLYYYRKYRKMGSLEISLIVGIIATIGHYLTWWVAYLEKKFEMEEILKPMRKRRERKKAKGKLSEEDDMTTEEVLVKELGYRRPTCWDFLPFVLYRLIVGFIKSIPTSIKEVVENYKAEKERKLREEEELKEAAEAAKIVRPKKVKQQVTLRDASEFENEDSFVPSWRSDNTSDVAGDGKPNNENKEWLEEDYAALAKAMAKFPGGTPGRWDRIAHELGRSAEEVTKKVKSMKESLASNIIVKSGGDTVVTKKKLAVNLSDSLVTKAIDNELNKTTIITDSDLYQSQYDIPDDYDDGVSCTEEPEIDYTIVTKKKVKTRPAEENKEEKESENDSSEQDKIETKEIDTWSQVQQKCLEAAIAQFPKSTSERWTCIARAVPEKTKEQCIARFKHLAEHVKQRKTKQAKGS